MIEFGFESKLPDEPTETCGIPARRISACVNRPGVRLSDVQCPSASVIRPNVNTLCSLVLTSFGIVNVLVEVTVAEQEQVTISESLRTPPMRSENQVKSKSSM